MMVQGGVVLIKSCWKKRRALREQLSVNLFFFLPLFSKEEEGQFTRLFPAAMMPGSGFSTGQDACTCHIIMAAELRSSNSAQVRRPGEAGSTCRAAQLTTTAAGHVIVHTFSVQP